MKDLLSQEDRDELASIVKDMLGPLGMKRFFIIGLDMEGAACICDLYQHGDDPLDTKAVLSAIAKGEFRDEIKFG